MGENYKLPDTNIKTNSTPLEVSPDDFLHHIEDFDLTVEQQKELLQTLWNIMSTFVDIGWGVDTLHLFLPELFNAQNTSKVASDSGKLLESINPSDCDHAQSNRKGQNHE